MAQRKYGQGEVIPKGPARWLIRWSIGRDAATGRYRVAVMLSKAELAQLGAEAKRADLPPSTVAYQAIARGLRRQRRK